MTEAQKTLYYIAENMRMDKSISKEGYEHFQQAIKALEQEPILDKIRAEIEQITDTMGVSYNQYVSKIDVLQIIDKYKGESEVDNGNNNHMRKYQMLQADYEKRLREDMVAMLTDIQLEIEELDTPNNGSAYMDCVEIIQQKINALKAESVET